MVLSRQQRRAAQRAAAKRLAAGAAIVIGAAVAPEAAHAATFTVTTTADSGAGSLRDAIAAANAAAGSDTIDFTVSGTITLTSGDLVITESVTIDGPGSSSLTISGNDSSRIFAISDSSAVTTQNVSIDGLTLTGGFSVNDGGAIFSKENLTITDAVITDNAANAGGGIHQTTADSLTLTNVTLSSNQATSKGAIHCQTVSNVTLSNVRISGNTATNFEAGAALASIGTLLIEDSTIENNTAPRVAGLLIFEGSGTVPATIRRTTISGNTADDWSAGARIARTIATIENSTISGNTATTGNGGGFYLYNSAITLDNSTVANNTAGANGGNIFLYDAGNSVTIENSIVANGSAPSNPDIENLGTITASYSLIEVPPPSMTGTFNITGTDPQLGSLQNNGGTTKTQLPAGTSPAINAGNPSFAAPPSTDQRGHARVADTIIDMGAVEVQSILSLSSATYSANENGGTLTVTVNRTGGGAGAVSVHYETSNGTADLTDYDLTSGTLNWADGDTTAKTFDVNVFDDGTFEGNETFDITLSSPGGGATIGTSAAVATITDNETQPTISIDNVTQFEGNSGTTAFTFEVMLSHPSAQTITVGYATANGTASDASDYTAASGTVTFNPEISSENVVVQVNGDTSNEADETFTVILSSPSNATIAAGTGTGTIQADDGPFTVTNTNNSGAGSLRNAIASANAVAGADTITFGVTGTIILGGELAITESVTIDGPGSSSLTISGDNFSRIFNISDDTATLHNVAIDGLTLTGGYVHPENGGAIRNLENLTVTDSVLTSNNANEGGALHHSLGSLTLTGVAFSSNDAHTCGALCVEESSTVTFSDVQITNNSANDIGGAGFSHIDTLVIEDSTISGNFSDAVGGLNFYYVGETASGIVRRTTISDNAALTTRGAMLLKFSDLLIENSTISGNSALGASGGGLYLYGSVATLEHSTMSGNTAATSGGNIFLYASTVTIENSIVANGSAPSGPDVMIFDAFSGAIANYSLIETPPAGLSGTFNLTGVDPQLGPLQNNGGPTLTHLPAGTSPVIDTGNPLFAAPPNTDQRGYAREANGTVDIGSVEVQSILSLSSATYSVDEDGSGVLTVTVNRTGGSSGTASVDYATSDGTAGASDYTTAEGDLSWADGDAAPKTFTVAITNDNIYEGNETFNITLDTPGDGATIGTAAAVATINEDDAKPDISIASVAANEGNSGTTNFTFPVTLSHPSVETITVNYSTANGTASAGSDYTAASGTLTFDPEETTQDVVVSVSGDTTVETDETFTVTLSSPTNSTIDSGTGTGTITADDTTAFGTPQLFSATAASASQVNLVWAPVAGATSYEIFRATSVTGGYSLLATISSTSYVDLAVSANTSYLYKVRAKNGETASDFTSVDAATTIVFTDATLNSAITAKAVHITQLRTAVNAMRAAAGLAAATFTDGTITAQSTTIKDEHITELRTALDAARAAIGLAALVYTDSTITPQSTTMKSAHATELRSGTQ